MVRKTGTAPKAKPPTKKDVEAAADRAEKKAAPKWGKGKADADAARVPMADETPQNISTGEERVDPAQTEQPWDAGAQAAMAEPPHPAPEQQPEPRASKPAENMGGNQTGVLISGVERIERLMEERQVIQDELKEVFGELKEAGFNTGILRKVLTRRKMDPQKRDEMDTLMDTYEFALEKRT